MVSKTKCPTIQSSRAVQLLLALALISTLASCAAPKPGATRMAATPVGYAHGLYAERLLSIDHHQPIPVFIVSGRNLLDRPTGIDPFGNERVDAAVPYLAIGEVSVGKGLTREQIIAETVAGDGKNQARIELERVEILPTPSVDNFQGNQRTLGARFSNHPWVRQLNEVLAASPSRQITIFVHGYNTAFIPNAELAAEISHFHARDGAVIYFDWPSQNSLTGYLVDKSNAIYSTRHFRGLLTVLARETSARKINIIAHSAGNPIAVNALRDLRLIDRSLSADELQALYRINRVTLAAPDMDLQTFMNAVFDRFHEVANGVAVYTSRNDKALSISRWLYGARRLGRAAEGLSDWERAALNRAQRIEMIDVTGSENLLSNSWLGHSYFHRNPWVSTDIGSFAEGISPTDRHLRLDDDGLFWSFPDNYPTYYR